MRAPFQKAPAPRIRALGGAPSRAKAPHPAAAGSTATTVFRDFVATLEKLDKGRKRRKPSGKEG
ncbi:hypothetical protein [Xanthobacter sp. ZOL 2024]